ncbi:MAG: AAA family ATPase [Arenimonas sp.]|uniref:AAA family ATPase n=1 Tax=Arenimonas sp. TaxID=1872635 RepID=UPI003C01DC83
MARLQNARDATPADLIAPSPIITEPKDNQPMPMQEPIIFDRPAPRPAQPAPQPMDQDARMKALLEILNPQTPALDEAAVLDIVTRNMGATISAATTSATEQARLALSDVLEEARAIVNGAPRTLRIEIKDRITPLPAAPRHPLFDMFLTLVVCGREKHGLPVMLVGPAGSGKTTACQDAAQALGLPFFTNGALTGAHELMGYKDAAGTYHSTPFRAAFEHGGVYLMDEMDRSDPAAVLSLNSALANGFAAFPDRAEPVKAHADFIPVVAANTFGRGADRLYIGANQLDASTLDRFAVLSWDYDEALERALAGDDAWTAYVQAARAAAVDLKIRHVISPRASMSGAVMRRAGLPFDMVAESALWKGLDKEQRERITARISDRITTRAQAPIIHAIAAE